MEGRAKERVGEGKGRGGERRGKERKEKKKKQLRTLPVTNTDNIK